VSLQSPAKLQSLVLVHPSSVNPELLSLQAQPQQQQFQQSPQPEKWLSKTQRGLKIFKTSMKVVKVANQVTNGVFKAQAVLSGNPGPMFAGNSIGGNGFGNGGTDFGNAEISIGNGATDFSNAGVSVSNGGTDFTNAGINFGNGGADFDIGGTGANVGTMINNGETSFDSGGTLFDNNNNVGGINRISGGSLGNGVGGLSMSSIYRALDSATKDHTKKRA